MSDTYNTTKATGVAAAESTAETGAYATERTKQEVGGTGQTYVEQVKSLAAGAVDTAKPYVDSGVAAVQNLTANAHNQGSRTLDAAGNSTTATGLSTQEHPQGTYVEQAKGLAATAVNATVASAQSLATAAKEKTNAATTQTSEATTELQKQAGETTDAAAAQGQANVASYLDQAKSLAGAILGTTQGILQAGGERLSGARDATSEHAANSGVLNTVQSTAATVLNTTAHYAGVTKDALAPHVDAAKTAAQPHVDAAASAAQPHIDNARTAAQPHLQTAQNTLANVQQAAQPHIDAASNALSSVQQAAQPHINTATNAASSALSSARATAEPHIADIQSRAEPHVQPSADATHAKISTGAAQASSGVEQASSGAKTVQEEVRSSIPRTDTTAANPAVGADAPFHSTNASSLNPLPTSISSEAGSAGFAPPASLPSTLPSTTGPEVTSTNPQARDQAHLDDAKRSLGL